MVTVITMITHSPIYSYYNRESHNHKHSLLPIATELIQPVELKDSVHLMEIHQVKMSHCIM